MQKTYHTIEEHKAGMHKHLKGWNSPHLERLIEATAPDALLLSHIYQRQALPLSFSRDALHTAPRPGHVWRSGNNHGMRVS